MSFRTLPLKMSENQRFPDVFRKVQMEIAEKNGGSLMFTGGMKREPYVKMGYLKKATTNTSNSHYQYI